MTSTSSDSGSARIVEPNHHAHHEGFSGLSGFRAALRFLSGRDEAATLAIARTGLGATDRVIDIGCGPGVAAQAAAAVGAEVMAVDPSVVMVRVGRARWARSGIDWRLGTAEELPSDDGWATVIWSLATVHHWVDLDKGLAEVVRSLAPGGRLLAVERRITDPFAEGTASHGWTRQQAETFGECCGSVGFVDVDVAEHVGDQTLISVRARLPAG